MIEVTITLDDNLGHRIVIQEARSSDSNESIKYTAELAVARAIAAKNAP